MSKDIEKGYGDRLRVLRSKMRISQPELAQRTKVSLGSINRTEKGYSIPSPINRQKLATFFDTDEWLNPKVQEKQKPYHLETTDLLRAKALAVAEEFPQIIEGLYEKIPKKKQDDPSDSVDCGEGVVRRI